MMNNGEVTFDLNVKEQWVFLVLASLLLLPASVFGSLKVIDKLLSSGGSLGYFDTFPVFGLLFYLIGLREWKRSVRHSKSVLTITTDGLFLREYRRTEDVQWKDVSAIGTGRQLEGNLRLPSLREKIRIDLKGKETSDPLWLLPERYGMTLEELMAVIAERLEDKSIIKMPPSEEKEGA